MRRRLETFEEANRSNVTNISPFATRTQYFPTEKEGVYRLEGKGGNKFGRFLIAGEGVVQPSSPPAAASGQPPEPPTMKVTVTKTYYTPDPNELPDPSERHDVQVTCMRGSMISRADEQTGHGVIEIAGKWSSDRLNLLVDPGELKADQIVSNFELR